MFRLFRSLVILLALSITGAAQVTGQYVPIPGGLQRQRPAATGDITVTGTVVNSLTGDPVSRALVQISGMFQGSVLTDNDGKFQFDGLSASQATFIARKPGYLSDVELQNGSMIRPVQIASGMAPVTIKLTPAGVISGHLTGPDGEPVEAAHLRMKLRMIQNGRRQWVERAGGNTDEDGAFRVPNLPPGAYYVFADGFSRRPVATKEVYLPAYFPGVSDLAGASPVEVRAGQTAVADMVLRKDKAHRITGIVTGLQPGQSAQVRLMTSGGEYLPTGTAVRRDDNSFELRFVPDGAYTLKVNAVQPFGMGSESFSSTSSSEGGPSVTRINRPRRAPQTYTGSMPINVTGDVSGIAIPVQPSANIPISIRTDFANPQKENEGSFVSFGDSRQRVRQYVNVTLTRVDAQGIQPAQMDENGTLWFRALEPGRYHAEFAPTGNIYVQSATFGSTDLLHDDLVLNTGGDQQAIDLVVRDDAASISGNAQCPDLPCWVVIVPDGNSAIQTRTAFVSAQGTFQAMGLPPGSYRLYALDRLQGIEYNNADAMKSYGSKAGNVVLSAGQKAQVNVELTKVVEQ